MNVMFALKASGEQHINIRVELKLLHLQGLSFLTSALVDL